MNIDGILIAASAPELAALLTEELNDAGWTGVAGFDPWRGDALAVVRALDPELVVVDLGTPTRAQREQVFRIAREGRWPVVAFVDQTDAAIIGAAVEAGVASYVVRGLGPNRIQPIVETPIARFGAMQRLRRERDEAVNAFDAFYCPVGR